MRVLDLFSGACGGWSLGFHRAGLRTVAACEIDEWRRRQYARNFPGVRIYNDVQQLTARQLKNDGVWPIDVVAGSPPCQDASTANTKGRGIEGMRTGLYLEAVRLVREIRPRWFSLENVPGIRNRGIDRVLGELEQEGYACWPLVVGALDIGAPHIRSRSWVIGADAATVQRLALPWDQSDRDSERDPANPDKRAVRQQSGRGGRAQRSASEAEPAELAVADEPRDGRRPRNAGRSGASAPGQQGELVAPSADCASQRQQEWRMGTPREAWIESPGVASDALGTRLEIERGEHRDDGAEQPALERAIAERLGAVAESWNGGIAGRLGMDDGLPKGMARPLLAAYGDAILPQIAEIIGRAILQAERGGVAA